MLASRFLDPVIGIDIHFELTPMGVPAPFPNPFIGLTWDPGGLLVGQAMGYAMALATGTPPTGPVFINFRPATNVGTEATNSLGVPHILIPPGVSWAPMPKPPKPAFKGPPDPPGLPVMPEGDAVHVMGSQTVTVMGSSAVRMGDVAMSCGEPVRLPSSTALPIPMGAPVLIGGPPSISLQDALGALVRTKWVAGHLHALLSRIKSDRLRNLLSKAVCFLTGHPVDVATGRVLTDAVDFELPGALPIRLERHYSSAWANRAGPLGHGWSHSLDQAVWPERGKVVYLDAEGREIEFDTFDYPDHRLPVGSEVYEPISRLTLKFYGKGRYAVSTHDGIRREFETIEARDGGSNGASMPADIRRRSRLVRERSREGAQLRYTYDEHARLARVGDPNGRQAMLEHDAHGRLMATHLPHPTEPGRFVLHSRYEYDAAGDLVRATDALGQSFSYEYQTHLLTRETNRNGLSFYFAYDGFGEDAFCTRTWGDGGIYDHLITYDKAGKVTLVKNSLGHTTSYFMNAVGLVTKVIDPLGNTTQYAYHEPSLQRSSLVDPAGATTTWEYDTRGNCTRVAYPDGATVQLEYDPRNLPVQATDALGGAWRWSYDREGRLIARSDPLDRSTQFHWDSYRLHAITDPAGQHTRLAYAASGDLDSLIAPDGATTRWQHDARGRCHTVIDPNDNAQRRDHDLLGRVTRVAEPDGNLRELEYDPEGNVVHARDRDHDVRFEYQGMGRLRARTEAGTRVEFRYDTEEQLVSIVNEHGAVYRFVLDPAGNVAEEHGFDGLRRKYRRDKAGRVALIFRPASATSKYSYDAAGRVARVEHSDGANEAYGYRLDGELARAQNAAATLEFDRDLLGRITEERSGEHWVTSEYDALGRRTTVRSSKGLEQRIRRNSLGDVLAIEARIDGESPRGPDSKPKTERPSSVPPPSSSRRFGDSEPRDAFRVDFERDRLGLELERRLPGGVQARWQRDSLGRPQVQEIRVRGVTLQARQYTWETNDRLRMIIDSMNGPVHYTHDALGNLAAATYQDGRVDLRMPDAVGNLFKTSDRGDRKYGPAGQLLEARDERGVTRYEYDAEGNLCRKTEPDGREWRYRWSLTGMLVEVKRPDGEAVGFTYDPLGRRLTKSFRGKTTHWIWDGNVPLHEWVELTDDALARDGEPLRNSFEREVAQAKRKAHLSRRTAQGPPELVYPSAATSDDAAPASLRGSGRDAEPLVLEGTVDAPVTWLFEPESFAPLGKLVADERHSIVTDHLGTPRAMFDAHGEETWSAEIDTYGQLQKLQGARKACPFRFPGQYDDEETGLYYNRFRYYDPEAGGYVSQDPIRLFGGLRLHGYVRDPLGCTDVLGLSGCNDAHQPIETPYGPAEQSLSPAALAARRQVGEGATLYRIGTVGRSEADTPQFWALEHPLSPGYPARYGIPPDNVANADFIETAVVKPGLPFVTRPAPPVGTNPGGGIEVVVPKGGAQLQSFSTKGAQW